MVRFLTIAASKGATLIRGRLLLECGTYFDLSCNCAALRGRHLFKAQR